MLQGHQPIMSTQGSPNISFGHRHMKNFFRLAVFQVHCQTLMGRVMHSTKKINFTIRTLSYCLKYFADFTM